MEALNSHSAATPYTLSENSVGPHLLFTVSGLDSSTNSSLNFLIGFSIHEYDQGRQRLG